MPAVTPAARKPAGAVTPVRWPACGLWCSGWALTACSSSTFSRGLLCWACSSAV